MALHVDLSDLEMQTRSQSKSAVARVAAAYRSDDAFVAGLLLLFGLAGIWLAFLDAAGCTLGGG